MHKSWMLSKNVKNSTKCISDTEKQDFSKFQIKTILHNHLENQDNFFFIHVWIESKFYEAYFDQKFDAKDLNFAPHKK